MAIKNNLDEIVNVDIEIATPGSSDESFSNILMVVEAPDKAADIEGGIGTKVIGISQAAELTDYGFSTEHQAYIMATVAYSQSPEPGTIYVIVRQTANDDDDENVIYEKMNEVLDRAKEAGGWYGIALSKTFLNATDIEETIKWTESNKKLFGFTFTERQLPVLQREMGSHLMVSMQGWRRKVT